MVCVVRVLVESELMMMMMMVMMMMMMMVVFDRVVYLSEVTLDLSQKHRVHTIIPKPAELSPDEE